MANFFILNIGGTVAPVAADKNANRLIAQAVSILSGEAAPVPVERIDPDAERSALFTRVASGEVSAADAAAELKAIDARVLAAHNAAKQAPPVLLLNDEPATAAEIKRAFRGAESGHRVNVMSLDRENEGVITMFRV